jgi:(p)ppGpp synthase/HD superfamily hydrolase
LWDTETIADELKELFGATVTAIVLEVTDDKSLDKHISKQRQFKHAPHRSRNRPCYFFFSPVTRGKNNGEAFF